MPPPRPRRLTLQNRCPERQAKSPRKATRTPPHEYAGSLREPDRTRKHPLSNQPPKARAGQLSTSRSARGALGPRTQVVLGGSSFVSSPPGPRLRAGSRAFHLQDLPQPSQAAHWTGTPQNSHRIRNDQQRTPPACRWATVPERRWCPCHRDGPRCTSSGRAQHRPTRLRWPLAPTAAQCPGARVRSAHSTQGNAMPWRPRALWPLASSKMPRRSLALRPLAPPALVWLLHQQKWQPGVGLVRSSVLNPSTPT